ncbi:hypothetical protein [Aureispira sp. CCB-QB1]|uniref:hypothetical protein n=1 Tax=Aureispira sp. CCB-QB1 TaxID=1313421 RepID=UPI000696385C|nr:hypothetical protein [Aureispira sp. CCB-QB1]
MAFRRNFNKADDAQIRRKIIVLIGTIVTVVILAQLAWELSHSDTPHLIEVEMLDRNQFIIQGDTTNYEEFASKLKKEVIQSKKEHLNNQIQLKLPPTSKQSKEVADIIMIVNGMNLDWEIKY